MNNKEMKLALRREGVWWVAYISMTGGEKSVEIARVIVRPAEENKMVKKMFMDLAMKVCEVATKNIGITIERWDDPVDAPESERSGNA